MSTSFHDSNFIGNNLVVQVAILVKDIETTMANWCTLLDVKNYGYKLTEAPEVTGIRYKGEVTPARAKLGFIKLGQVVLEIIEPDQNPSIWREALDKNGEGFHHLAFNVEGLDEKVARFSANGMPEIQTADYGGGRYSYVNTLEPLKMILELLEAHK